jgi:hypothetical protein
LGMVRTQLRMLQEERGLRPGSPKGSKWRDRPDLSVYDLEDPQIDPQISL